jgi:hypothetical protein
MPLSPYPELWEPDAGARSPLGAGELANGTVSVLQGRRVPSGGHAIPRGTPAFGLRAVVYEGSEERFAVVDWFADQADSRARRVVVLGSVLAQLKDGSWKSGQTYEVGGHPAEAGEESGPR